METLRVWDRMVRRLSSVLETNATSCVYIVNDPSSSYVQIPAIVILGSSIFEYVTSIERLPQDPSRLYHRSREELDHVTVFYPQYFRQSGSSLLASYPNTTYIIFVGLRDKVLTKEVHLVFDITWI